MRNIAFAGSRYTWKTVKKQPDFTPILRWPCLVASDALWNVDQAGFYVEPLSPEYQNDSKTPVRFVRKMVGIYGQSGRSLILYYTEKGWLIKTS